LRHVHHIHEGYLKKIKIEFVTKLPELNFPDLSRSLAKIYSSELILGIHIIRINSTPENSLDIGEFENIFLALGQRILISPERLLVKRC